MTDYHRKFETKNQKAFFNNLFRFTPALLFVPIIFQQIALNFTFVIERTIASLYSSFSCVLCSIYSRCFLNKSYVDDRIRTLVLSITSCDKLVIEQNISYELLKAGALVQWLWEMTHDQKVVGSNPRTVNWMELTFFTLIYCKNCIEVCLKRPKINEKEAGVGPFVTKPHTLVSFKKNLQ